MKDRYAILILAFLLAILFQLSIEIPSLENNWVFENPFIILLLLTVFLTIIQRQRGNTFSKHLLKSIKIGIFLLILYFPICLIFSFRWMGNFESSLSKVLGIIPEILASMITAGLMIFGPLLIVVGLSYLFGKKEN